jgi:hypothetical protein
MLYPFWFRLRRVREQAIGSAYATQRLESTARYEVHLDRKLERRLAMLIRLREELHGLCRDVLSIASILGTFVLNL